MNRRTAAPVILTVSLVVLMSGCAGAAALGGQVRDDLRPAANAAVMGLARGHVVVRDDLVKNRITDAMAALALADPHGFSADARRELHSQPVAVEQSVMSADARRELKGSAPVDVQDDLSPIRGDTPTTAPEGDTVDDDLSPLGY